MTPNELARYFRGQVSDEDVPHLWSDEEILQYMVSAQDQMVRTFGGFADTTTPAIVRLPLVAGQPYTAHSPYILRIRSGRLVTDAHDVKFIQESDLGMETVLDYGHQTGLSLDDTTGVVTHGILGIEEKKVRWYRVPASADVCMLHVFRLPYPRLTALDSGALEVDEQYHVDLTTGMMARAYAKQDAETRNDKLAREFAQEYAAVCDRVRIEHDRRSYRPRQVRYGGL